MSSPRKRLIKQCEEKLLDLKYRYLLTLSSPTNNSAEESKEVVDQANATSQASTSNFFRERMRSILPEIEYALLKIKNRTYGTCEITGEDIEEKRLLAVPWTRISMKAHNLEAS